MNTVMTPAVPIVAPERFVLATRDTGYRSAAAAICELIDNSIQAKSSQIDVLFGNPSEDQDSFLIAVLDDGCGMSPEILRRALQFGGTSRFGDRSGLGRFGMGLPNSSVSHSRRVELYSWTRAKEVYFSYLDVDEVATGRMNGIPAATRCSLPPWLKSRTGRSGTLIVWRRCDRLSRFRVETLARRMRASLGRIYRYALWGGVRIAIDHEFVEPFDPLFVDERATLRGARAYGAPLVYKLTGFSGEPSAIQVRFSELPVHRWHGWPVDDKRRRGIVGGAGVSFVRAGREIDYGWHLFGGKRRENYDDWWRCEVQFSPDLDEMFGVTHSKQGVNPRTELKLLLSMDLEEVARALNRRVRQHFDRVKQLAPSQDHAQLSRRDALLSPPASLVSRKMAAGGLRYRTEYKPLATPEFYSVRVTRSSIVVTVNTDHPFFTEIYQRASQPGGCGLDHVERLVLAAARADLEARGDEEREHTARLRRAWSDALAAFLRH